MRRAWFAIALLAGSMAARARAQLPTVELRPFAAAYVPTGALRSRIDDGFLVGVQGALEFRRTLHVTGTLAWMPGRARYQAADDGVDVVQYDVGVEWGAVRASGTQWELHPYFGLGAGGRSFEYRATTLTDRLCALAYVAGGAELQLRRLGVRVEARDNIFCFKSPVAGERSRTRNDLWLAVGLALHFPS